MIVNGIGESRTGPPQVTLGGNPVAARGVSSLLLRAWAVLLPRLRIACSSEPELSLWEVGV
jgi:hypothetical protein